MQKTSMSIAVAALVACAVLVIRLQASNAVRAETESALAARLERLETSVGQAPASSAADPTALARELEELRARIRELEERRRPAELAATEPEPAGDAATKAPPAAETDGSATTAEERAEFDALLDELGLGHGKYETGAKLERFYELARGTGVIAEAIAKLEAEVAARPDDLEARLELAEYYIAKLYTVPGGPEQGIWNDRAEKQWQEVVARDPRNWEAQFTLANNWSYYPSFLNKTNDAIRGLELAREIQEGLPSRPDFVDTYLSLSRMYVRKAKRDEARATLLAGLAYHPGDARLLAALEELK